MFKQLAKKLYKKMPLKKELFSLIKRFYVPPFYKYLTFEDVFTVRIDEKHSFKIYHNGLNVENELFWCGLNCKNWERTTIKLWIELAKTADTVFDIGAYTGIYSLIAASVNPEAKIFSFEPVESIFLQLKKNIELNGFKIEAIKKAVSNFDGTSKIKVPLNPHEGSPSFYLDIKNHRVETCEVITLEKFILENKLKPSLMKIDVEGLEAEVLSGMGEYLKKFMPDMIVEVLDENVARKLNNLIPDGYKFFSIDEMAGIKEEKVIKPYFKESILHRNYLLCKKEIFKNTSVEKMIKE